ncbi:group II intron maturase-specific domain-containing protein [Sporosarcina sp. P19]|uniref:group II intron maturase-specific domain-containing protein n=1 Tax=Sporosarcina sp. P19 TaxID=2048258 RepID=UPI001E5A40D3|nr:group II intron maturase-specific domain-containing protein [Sporosarcina sp. P19]
MDRPWKRKFLGFIFTFQKESKVPIPEESLKRIKNKIREITSRKKSYPIDYRIKKLNQYLLGWCSSFVLGEGQVFSETSILGLEEGFECLRVKTGRY